MGGGVAIKALATAVGYFGSIGTLSLLSNIIYDNSLKMTPNEIGDSLEALTPDANDNAEASRIGKAITHTWNNNNSYFFRDLMPFASMGTQQVKGYYCYEWAIAFKKAMDKESPAQFSVTLESSALAAC
jgi:hypothetical protein